MNAVVNWKTLSHEARLAALLKLSTNSSPERPILLDNLFNSTEPTKVSVTKPFSVNGKNTGTLTLNVETPHPSGNVMKQEFLYSGMGYYKFELTSGYKFEDKKLPSKAKADQYIQEALAALSKPVNLKAEHFTPGGKIKAA